MFYWPKSCMEECTQVNLTVRFHDIQTDYMEYMEFQKFTNQKFVVDMMKNYIHIYASRRSPRGKIAEDSA